MAINDRVLLGEYLAARKSEIAQELSDADFFELFVAEQTLKNYDLDYEEIVDGVVGGSNDGGIDGVYTFINSTLLDDSFNFDRSGPQPLLEFYIMQAKRSGGFSEEPINKIISSMRLLLDLSYDYATDPENRSKRFSPELLGKFEEFRSAYQRLAGRLPRVVLRVRYAAEASELHPNVKSKVKELETALHDLFSQSELDFSFLNAGDLLQLARSQPNESVTVTVAAAFSTGDDGIVSLVPLKSFNGLLIDDTGSLRRSIFDANVRDYQGETNVNQEIAATLRNPGEEDFWWLNNGVTVLATAARLAGNKLTIANPQIVNGLQTSMQINKHFAEQPNGLSDEQRRVLVRVIVPSDEASRDKIIKATNSQTYMPLVSLHALDSLQQDIEDYFKPRGYFYDRRKNYYKNLGRPIDKIISLPYLAQAVTAILLQEPDTARARPSTLLRDAKDYSRVFNAKLPVAFYLACTQLMRSVEIFIRSHVEVHKSQRNNVRFYVAAIGTVLVTKNQKPTSYLIERIDLVEFNRTLTKAVALVLETFISLEAETRQTWDRLAKSKSVITHLKDRLLDAPDEFAEPVFDQAE